MLKQRHKTLSMLCFVCLIYFTAITVNLFEPNAGILDILEMAWVAILFIATMLYSRSIQKHRYQLAMQASDNEESNNE
ncbi:MAG: DUF2069 domain-containing protein, partial [Porticoccaceae bacterium]|nr:DUF2069 domain-containing protein [Porticoccaceae bacterium]